MNNEKIIRTARQILTLLVQGNYSELENLTNSRRLNQAEIADSIQQYGKILVLPPDSTFDNLDIIEIEGKSPKQWDVRIDLWTLEEGRSDLTIELTLEDNDEDMCSVEIDNIHVL